MGIEEFHDYLLEGYEELAARRAGLRKEIRLAWTIWREAIRLVSGGSFSWEHGGA